jgi:hypothetical protein
MRIFPIAIALGLVLAGPALAASKSAKMTGQDQNATGPARHHSQSAKMHGTADTGGTNKRPSVLRSRAER